MRPVSAPFAHRQGMTPAPDEIARYCGTTVVAVEDLANLGMSTSTIAHRCRPEGPWQRLLPGVVLLHNGPITRDDRRRAAVVHCGAGTLITGLDALQLQGMARMPHPSGPVHVLLPADRRRAGAGRVLAERTDRLPPAHPGRWPLAPPARAALDGSRRLTSRTEVRATLAEVVQRGRCTPADLFRELADGSGRGSALPRAVLAEVADGVRSAAEAQARQLVLRSGLPAPWWNPKLYGRGGAFVAMPDAWFDDVGLAWEIDSTEWHLDPADYTRTLDRRSAMMAAGIIVMHTQPRKLSERPREALEELRATHQDAARRTRPHVVAIPAQAERAALSSSHVG